MRSWRRLVAVLLVASAEPMSAQAGDPLAHRFDALLGPSLGATTPGCVVGAAREGLPTLYRTYGLADLEHPVANDTATVFEAGSVSKQFTAAAVVLLAQAGRLSLDDQVRRWVPELAAEQPPMTVRQLLQHQAGLRDWGHVVELSGWPRGTRRYAQDEIVALIARQRATDFTPGSEYSYSNSGYVLAAHIVARASGESFAAYTARAIFVPLGMTRTQWRDDPTRPVPGRARGWSPSDSGWRIDTPMEDVVGHGGLLTTVPDLLRWQANFLRPDVGGPAFVAEMERVGVLASGRATGYALGLEVEQVNGERAVSHGGWTQGYKSYVGRVPARRVAVALLCNAGSLDTEQLGAALLAAAVGDTSSPAAERAPDLGPPSADARRQAVAGQYRSSRTGQPVQVRAFEGGITVNRWQGYRAVSADSFVQVDGGRVLRVERDAKGTVARYRVRSPAGDVVSYERAEPWEPTAATLRGIAGRYRSDEADAMWTVEAAGDTLFVRRRTGQRDAMEPRYRDAFVVPSAGWLVLVRRNGSGRVTR
ncbi:MAG: beta-lactamase family protein, partial [Gemmatimonadales bacterium]|nr:beta-lactamase family protein [Gemmatimonadales bacterium]